MTVFFGIVFGAFALGMGAPLAKAIKEGQAAAKSGFDVIDRVPSILVDDKDAKS